MLELVLFSSICGVFGKPFLVMPHDSFLYKESVFLTCGTDPGWGPFAVYDKNTDIFKVYHDTEGCNGNLLLDKKPVYFKTGSWQSIRNFGVYRCKAIDGLCIAFNLETPPNVDLLQISYKFGEDYTHSFVCEKYRHNLKIQNSHDNNLNTLTNLPLFGNEETCSFMKNDISQQSAEINLGSLKNHKKGFLGFGSLEKISVLLPETHSWVKVYDGYIFKVVMNTTHRLPIMVAMCFKSKPHEPCDRYGSKMVAKDAIKGFRLFFKEKYFSNDVYMEIVGWGTSFKRSKLNTVSEIIFTHRVNQRILKEAQDRVFSKVNDFGKLYFHFHKCDAGNIPCDEEEDRKVSVSLIIYGVAEVRQMKYLYIQADRGERTTTCNNMDSHCHVRFITTKYKDMILHYDYLGIVCLWKHVADTESRTKVCKDISMSITVVDL